MRMMQLFAVLLLCGCEGIRAAFGYVDCASQTDPQPPLSEQTLRAAWGVRFGSMDAVAACKNHWTWNVVSSADQDAVCSSKIDAACTIYPSGCPTTFTTATYARDQRLAAHEFSHWALLCTTGNSDTDHVLHPEVWSGFVAQFPDIQ